MTSTTAPGLPRQAVAGRHWIRISTIVVAALGIGGYLAVVLARVGYPYELAYFEGSTVEVTARLVEGGSLYGPPGPDFTPWPYPPMYFWLAAGATQVLALDLPTMRWVSVLASVVVLILIAAIAYSLTASRWAALLGAGLYAATYRVAGAWADTARVDSVFLAWLTAAIAVALRARTWRGGVAVGLLFVAAFLTKQNAVIVAGPVVLALLVRRRPVGLAAGLTVLVGSLGSVVVGDLLTGGWYSPYVVAQLLGHPIAFDWVVWFWLVDVALPLLLLSAVVAWLLWRARGTRPAPAASPGADPAVFSAALGGLLLAGWAGRLHEGGTSNVAMPTHLALALILAVLVHRLVARTPLTTRQTLGLAGALVAQVLVLLLWRVDVIPTQADRVAGDRMIQRLTDSPGPVLVASHPYYARLAGSPPHASAIAVGDLLASHSSRARDNLEAQLPWSLTGVNTVVADSPANAASLGPELVEQFALVTDQLVPPDVFVPVTDYPTQPRMLYVRTREPAP